MVSRSLHRSEGETTVNEGRANKLAATALGDAMVDMHCIADHIGVTYRTVQVWRHNGTLPPPDFTLGKVKRWRRLTIKRFVDARQGTQA